MASTRKHIETNNDKLKAMSICVGSGNMHSEHSDLVECVIEHGKDPEMKPPDDISTTDAKNKMK